LGEPRHASDGTPRWQLAGLPRSIYVAAVLDCGDGDDVLLVVDLE
jgi:hypothetical protein